MDKIKTIPLSPTGEQPIDFYSWGDPSLIGLMSKRKQDEGHLEEAFDSIEIKEDKETPETDYVLKVLGRDAGRVVIPFDMVVKDAYYDKETKEVVIVVRIGEGEEKEIRFSVKDLIDIYTGDEVTIHVENNVISITKEVMDKFDSLRKSIDYEKQYRKDGDEKLKQALDFETSSREAEDAILNQTIETVKENLEKEISEISSQIEGEIKTEKEAREAADANLLQLINNVETNLEGAVANLAANDASLEAQIKAEKEAREASETTLSQSITDVATNLEQSVSDLTAKDASLESQIKTNKDEWEKALAKETADRKDADTEIIKDYNDKIDKVQDNLQDLSKAHIESVSKLQEADAQLHKEIMDVRSECYSEPIPLEKIRALFT